MPSSDQLETPVAFWKLPRGRRRRFCSLQSGDGSLFDFVRDFKAKKKTRRNGRELVFSSFVRTLPSLVEENLLVTSLGASAFRAFRLPACFAEPFSATRTHRSDNL